MDSYVQNQQSTPQNNTSKNKSFFKKIVIGLVILIILLIWFLFQSKSKIFGLNPFNPVKKDILVVHNIPEYNEVQSNLKFIFNENIEVLKGMTLRGDIEGEGSNINLGDGTIIASNILYSLTAGTGISITGGQNPTISSTVTSTSGVTSVEGITGAVDLVSGNNISFSVNGNQLTITAASGGSATDTNTTYTAGDDLTLTDTTFSLNDVIDVTEINLPSGGIISFGGVSLSSTGGSTLVGVDTTSFDNSSSTILQDVLADLDASISSMSGGGSTSSQWTDLGIYIYPSSNEYLGNNAVAGSNKITGIFLADNAPIVYGTDNDFRTLFNGTNLILGDSSNTFLAIGDSGTTANFNFNQNQFYIRGDGNVGIGTTAPGFALDVNGVAQASSGFRTNGETITDFTGTGITTTGGSLMIDILSAASGTGSTASFSGFEFIGNELTLLQGCSDSEVLAWDNSNNVWECTPVGSLVSSGDITAVGNIQTGDAFSAGTPGSQLFFANSGFLGLGAAAGRISFSDDTVDEISFLSANVGIGKTNPAFTLDINGTLQVGDTAIFNNVPLIVDNNKVLTVDGSGKLSYIDSSSFDKDTNNDLITGTQFTGDVSGVYNNLQIGATAVGASELASTSVTAGSYGGVSGTAAYVPTFTVDADGRLTAAGTSPFVLPPSENPLVFLNGLTRTGNNINLGGSLTQNTRFFTSGTEVLYLSTTGGVGIGTTAPGFALDVNGIAQASAGFRTNNETVTDFTGIGLTISGGALTVDVLSSSVATGSTASFSGLEFVGNRLTLLQGCADTEVLSWNDTANRWECTSISGVIAGDITAVGNITSGDAFTSGTPGSQLFFANSGFLGLGAAAGRISFSDDTIDEISFLSANVGIGKTNPAFTLDINGTLSVGDTAIFNNVALISDNNKVLTVDGSGKLSYIDSTSFDKDFNNDLTTSTQFTGDVSGVYNNLQIGATAVGANELENTAVTAGSYGGVSGTAAYIVNFTVDADGRLTAAGTSPFVLPPSENPLVFLNGLTRTGNNIDLGGSLTQNTRFFTAGTEVLFLSTTGGVGIGTTSPGFALDVNGIAQASAGFRTNNETVSDFTGIGLTISGGALTVDVLSSSVATGSTASYSGLEFVGNRLSLLQGCTDNDVLAWDDTANRWECISVAAVGAGDITAVGNIIGGDAFTSGTPGSQLFFANSGFLGLGAAAGRISFSDDTVDEISFLSANVGIGKTNPAFTLDINGTLSVGDTAIFNNVALVADNNKVLTVDGSGKLSYIDSSSFDKDINNDLTTSTQFTGDVSGVYNNLQIGATAVGANELENTAVTAGSYGGVSGTAAYIVNFTVDADGRLTAAGTSPFVLPPSENPLVFLNGLTRTGNNIDLGGSLTQNTRFFTAGTEVLFLSTTGGVGIGTTGLTSGMTLDVAGNIRAGTELFMGNIGLNDTGNDRATSGASQIGTFNEFTNVSVGSSTVQDVLDDLDAAITTIASGTSVAWTDAGAYLHPTDGEYLGNNAVAGSNKLAGLFLADNAPVVYGTDNDFRTLFNGTNFILGDSSNTFMSVGDSGSTGNFNFNNNQMYLRGDGFLGLGTTAPSAQMSIYGTSTSTAYKGFSLDWVPTAETTLSGDLFSINIGASGNAQNLFAIYDNGSSIFKVSENQIESAVPHTFTAAGDVSIAFDLEFTNQTASYIKSLAPMVIQSGESFESNNLTLQTFNNGNIVLNNYTNGIIATFMGTGNVGIATENPAAKLDVFGTTWLRGGTNPTGLYVAVGGNVAIGHTAPASGYMLDIGGSVQLDIGQSASSFALCHQTNGAGTNQGIFDCATTVNADYMEMYATDNDVVTGDLLASGSQYVTTTEGERVVKLKKTTQPYQASVIGIASNPKAAGDFNSVGNNIHQDDNPYPVALSGRLKVKVTEENGSIAIGDFIAASSSPGKGMKATKAGMVVGQALEAWDSNSGSDRVMVFVKNIYYEPPASFASNTNNFSINESLDGYEVRSNNGNVISQVAAFDSGYFSSLDAGTVAAEEIILSGVDLSSSISGIQLQLQGVENELSLIESLPDWQSGIETQLNSQAAQIMTLKEKIEGAINRIDLMEPVASDEAKIDSLAERVTFLEQMLFGSEATDEAKLAGGINFVPPQEGEVLGVEDTELVLEDLTVSGKTNLFDLGVIGDVSIGQIAIRGKEAAINSLALPLQLQSTSMAPLEIMGGKVIVDTKGNVTVKEEITASKFNVKSDDREKASIGTGNIKIGETAIVIESTSVTKDSTIFLTPTTDTDTPIAVIHKVPGKSFKVKISKEIVKDLKFNWWIVN